METCACAHQASLTTAHHLWLPSLGQAATRRHAAGVDADCSLPPDVCVFVAFDKDMDLIIHRSIRHHYISNTENTTKLSDILTFLSWSSKLP